MNHLYEDKKGIVHACESGDFNFYQNPIKLAWTKCGKDVPANKSFKSGEQPTCKCCSA